MQVCKKPMTNIIKRISYSVLLSLPLSAFAIESQEVGISLSGESLGSVESGAGSKFSSSQTALTLPLEHKQKSNEMFTSFFHLDITKFDWQGTTAAQNDYVWVSMPIYYSQNRGRKNKFLINFEPGLMTDGGSIEQEAIGLNGSLIGRRMWRNGGYWQYGVIVDRAFGDSELRPVLGVAWQATKSTWMELGFPKVNIKHQFSSSVHSFFVIKPAGGVWQETVKATAGNEDASLNYTNWQVGFGGEFHWRGKIWLNGEVGQLRHRRIHAMDTTGAKIKATPGQDRYWTVGAKVRF